MALSQDPTIRERQLANLRKVPAVTREQIEGILEELPALFERQRSRIPAKSRSETSTRTLIEAALRELAERRLDVAPAARTVLQCLPYLDGEADFIELVDSYARAAEEMSDD